MAAGVAMMAAQAQAGQGQAQAQQADAGRGQAGAAAPVSTAQALAAELAEVLTPREAMLGNLHANAVSAIDKGLAQDPNLPPAEAKHPGLAAAMKAAGLAAVEPVFNDACMDLAVRHRELLARSFTVPELRELLAFYRSPEARQGAAAALAQARAALSPAEKKRMGERAGAGALTDQEFQAMVAPGTTPKVPPAVERAFLKFAESAVAEKLAVVTPEFQSVTVGWMNETAPKVQSTMRDAMMEKATAYMAGNR